MHCRICTPLLPLATRGSILRKITFRFRHDFTPSPFFNFVLPCCCYALLSLLLSPSGSLRISLHLSPSPSITFSPACSLSLCLSPTLSLPCPTCCCVRTGGASGRTPTPPICPLARMEERSVVNTVCAMCVFFNETDISTHLQPAQPVPVPMPRASSYSNREPSLFCGYNYETEIHIAKYSKAVDTRAKNNASQTRHTICKKKERKETKREEKKRNINEGKKTTATIQHSLDNLEVHELVIF